MHFSYLGDYFYSTLPSGELEITGIRERRYPFVVIPDGVIEIGAHAFDNYASLSEVVLPDSVKGIGEGAFAHCVSLKHIDLPSGLVSIGSAAFASCGLVELTLPERVSCIGYRAFSGCFDLKSVELLSKELTELPQRSFQGCRRLRTLSVPGCVKRIGAEAFKNCESLSEVYIAEGVELIDKEAFYNCPRLEKAVLPPTLRRIAEGAFGGIGGGFRKPQIIYCGGRAEWAETEIEPGNGVITGSDIIYLDDSREKD